MLNKSVDIMVNDRSETVTAIDKFFYDYDNTPKITDLSPNELNVLGDEIIICKGVNLPICQTIKIGDKIVNVISSNDTSIVFKSPKMNPGLYNLIISSNQLGYVK